MTHTELLLLSLRYLTELRLLIELFLKARYWVLLNLISIILNRRCLILLSRLGGVSLLLRLQDSQHPGMLRELHLQVRPDRQRLSSHLFRHALFSHSWHLRQLIGEPRRSRRSIPVFLRLITNCSIILLHLFVLCAHNLTFEVERPRLVSVGSSLFLLHALALLKPIDLTIDILVGFEVVVNVAATSQLVFIVALITTVIIVEMRASLADQMNARSLSRKAVPTTAAQFDVTTELGFPLEARLNMRRTQLHLEAGLAVLLY